MKKRNGNQQRFVICVDNSGYPASLQLHKVYRTLPDERAAEDDFLRVIDESGEDYLYSTKRFVGVELPQKVKRSIIRKVRETTMMTSALQRSKHVPHGSKTRKNSRVARP